MTATTDQLPARVAEVRVRETSPAHMLKVIAEAAANPECDAGKMKALHDLMKDVYEFEGKKAFTRAFNALQAELPAITRDGRIDHSADGGERTRSGKKALKTGYATYHNIMSVVNPLLKKNGFTLSNVVEPSPDGARIHVVGYLEHIDGHSRVSRFPMSIDTTGGKNNQQGWGSSQQYAMRYNAIALLNIVSEAPQDQDNDGFTQKPKPRSANDPEPQREEAPPDLDFPGDRDPVITEDQALKVREAIEACGVSTKTFCDKFGIDRVAALPAAKFSAAMDACKNYGAARNG